MKILHIFLLIVIAVCIAAVVSTVGKSTTYESFAYATLNPDEELHVVGNLMKDREMIYDPATKPNYFEFWLIDLEGNERQVVYKDTKPMDMEQSERIVVIGSMGSDGKFQADQILKKCPSKYSEKNID